MYDDGNLINHKNVQLFIRHIKMQMIIVLLVYLLNIQKKINVSLVQVILIICLNQKCINCKLNLKNCIECNSILLREFDNKTQTCICMIGTTDINGVCQISDINCLKFINAICNCSSWKNFKLLISNKCQCIEGTYETGVDKECQLCNATCLTCINQENYCTSRSTGNICICQEGYFEDLVTFTYKQCKFSCLACQVTSKNCQSCDSKMNLSLDFKNKCFYLNSTSKICEACNITCKECQNLTQCNECESITRHIDSENLQFLCKDEYFEVNQRKCSLIKFVVNNRIQYNLQNLNQLSDEMQNM
ncbi:unnamed protein product [Paramecium sonneborni]|uniref:Transmembrane protein n=1 Tax=Paramecium sonneborni TaxID=65129 RepID=A0A8S1RMR5_9CILI|nr:unnamed protein product [Paramecium sonneborni]